MIIKSPLTLVALVVLSIGASLDAQTPAATAARTEETPPPSRTGSLARARRWASSQGASEPTGQGFYLRVGGMTTDSGLALGPGYRRAFLPSTDGFLDLSAALSTKAYKAFDAKARWARAWGQRVELWSEFRYRDYSEEDFFGIGQETHHDTRTSYSIESTDLVARGLVRMTPWLRVGGELGFLHPHVGHGSDPSISSIEDLFDEASAPGLTDQPHFLHQALFVEVDTRRPRGAPVRGGFSRVSFTTWNDTSLDRHDHHRIDAEVSRFIALRGPDHVFAARVGLGHVRQETGRLVPFYLLPYLGGAETMRGFREFRFRDHDILFANFEYRWRARSWLDVAPFLDAGEARSAWNDIELAALRTTYGLGVRLNLAERTMFRIDVGTGGQEGVRVFFKFGPSF